jgi:hypothetical protein
MTIPFCSHCLAPLSRRERLFDSLLCVACEQKLTAYEGPLPNPNLSFGKGNVGPHRATETTLPSDSRSIIGC